MAEHWTKALQAEVAALRDEVAALKAGAAPQAMTATMNPEPARGAEPEYANFYRSLIVSLAASQGMGTFNPESLAGVRANAGMAFLVWQEMCQNHEASIAQAKERDALLKKRDADLAAQAAANQAARALRRHRTAATPGQVTIQTPVSGANGLTSDESALVAAAQASGLLPSNGEV